MQTDEGYIKFQAKWQRSTALDWRQLEDLNRWRVKMYQLGLIGAYDNGIGFGNISCRWKDTDQFIISGSTTGNFEKLTAEHYALVKAVDIDQNTLVCEGPIIASSESMSHAVVYQAMPEVGGVIHVHHLELWQRLLHQVPTTAPEATYGSPEMAYSILDLIKHSDVKTQRIFVMEGHREGIFVFGRSLEEAAERLTYYGRKFALY